MSAEKSMTIWSSIFGPRNGGAAPVEIRPSGLLMDADGWFYEESLDAECPLKTIRVQQNRPGEWYVRDSNCGVAELNSPSCAAEVFGFFAGSFRWLRFEREAKKRHGPGAIRIIGSFLDENGAECESHLGYVEQEVAKNITYQDVGHLWARLRCIRPPGAGRRPNFYLRFDLLVELDEELSDDDVNIKARLERFLPLSP